MCLRASLTMVAIAAASAQDVMAIPPPGQCEATGVDRRITSFEARSSVDLDHAVLSWHAEDFDAGTEFQAWRSIDGGVTFEADSCATLQGGQCFIVSYSQGTDDYSAVDYGVRNNFLYSYVIRDSEGGDYWYMTSSFWGSLSKPDAPAPSVIPQFSFENLSTNSTLRLHKVRNGLTSTS
jgi:hypothetical protein